MPEPVPVREFTDEEWIRAMREFDPSTPATEVEQAIGRWREEAQGG